MASQIGMHKSPLVGFAEPPKHRASDSLRLVQGSIICISNGSLVDAVADDAGQMPYTLRSIGPGEAKDNLFVTILLWKKETLQRPCSDKNAINLEIYNQQC